jgi:hypothetical protein
MKGFFHQAEHGKTSCSAFFLGLQSERTTSWLRKEPKMAMFAPLSWLQALSRSQFHFGAPTTTKPGPAPGFLSRQRLRSSPKYVRESQAAMKYLHLFERLDWDRFPDRPDQRFSPDCPPISLISFIIAYLIKIDRRMAYMSELHTYLCENPALIWLLGFPLQPSNDFSWGFDPQASLPSHRHLSRLLRTIPNASLQFLLDETIRLIQTELTSEGLFGDCISLDTKHIIAWVKENNPKAYVSDRYDKTKQPIGDSDCRLGCKRKHNQRKGKGTIENLPTPTKNSIPAAHLEIGEYYWGYGSGVVATKVAEWGEFVLAELTQPFDQADVSYFHPLMQQVERRLGRKPHYGAFDAAYDAFYVYEYFADASGFAAVPFVERGGKGKKSFGEDGSPLCAAGFPMFLRYNFQKKSALIPHERSRFVCPLRFPKHSADTCPVDHKNWAKQGCVSTIASSPGSRLRYQIDRESQTYKDVYKQRTATERVNSRAVDLGIERPRLRNGAAVANHNTLTYVLINLHALQRISQRQAERLQASSA